MFIQGNLVSLRRPDIQKDIIGGQWHNWFNDESTTKYLIHGRFENTRESQIEFVEGQLKDENVTIFSVVDNHTNKMIGVISLKEIDLLNRTAEITIVFGAKDYPRGAPLEAMALMTRHGFNKLNLNKIQAGHHIDLWRWVNTQELIGYKLEGYISETHIKDRLISDSVRIGITLKAFEAVIASRPEYIPEDITTLLKFRRKENICLALKEKIQELYD